VTLFALKEYVYFEKNWKSIQGERIKVENLVRQDKVLFHLYSHLKESYFHLFHYLPASEKIKALFELTNKGILSEEDISSPKLKELFSGKEIDLAKLNSTDIYNLGMVLTREPVWKVHKEGELVQPFIEEIKRRKPNSKSEEVAKKKLMSRLRLLPHFNFQ